MTIELRPIADEDIEAYFHLMNDESVAIMAGTVPHPVTLEWARERIVTRRKQEEEGALAQRGLFRDGELVGDVSYFFRDGDIEIGYAIGKAHRGQGLATIAARLGVELVRDHGLVGPIHAGYAQDNPASGRVLEKVGFIHTGEGMGTSMGRGGDMPLYKTIYRDDIRLRPHKAEDFEILHGFVDDDALYQAGGGARDESAGAMQKRIEGYIDKGALFNVIQYEGAVAGYLGAYARDGKWEVSYWLGPDFRGKGLAERALSAWLMDAPPFEGGLYARVAKDHAASVRVLEKCEFERMGEDTYHSPHRGEDVGEWIYRSTHDR
ncbi:GNAT family N-acetyltransferase [Kordiimonas aestuarii]|uniref:GNAT family N-acetyltransferase n=1 Tax=Kordiimonas aestuarii TaxID=1005925 RepID=UPI0021D27699|nr:GNAT family N-acetyltransferase [Kordiimonas aestuarii]